jgi:hypothetical protein
MKITVPTSFPGFGKAWSALGNEGRKHRLHTGSRPLDELDLATPASHELCDDREAETGARTGSPAARSSVEAIEELRLCLLGLRGPGISRSLTGVDFVGTKTATVRFAAGRYAFVCTPHSDDMRGAISVR